MRGIDALTRTAWLLAMGLAACAPASEGDWRGNDGAPGERMSRQASAPFIDVAPNSPVTLALRGGMGPIVEGQTVNSAVVTFQSIQLVGVDGNVVPLLDQPMTVDLLALQNSLEDLVSQVPLPPGRFSHLRCQLGGAYIEAAGPDGGVQLYATPGMEMGQFGMPGPAGPLQLAGIQPGGYFDVAIPPDGIAVQGETSLAMQFDLAASLSFESGLWTLDPRMWVVNESVFASLEVQFQAAQAAGFSEFAVQGFDVMLFDAGMSPIAYAPLGLLPGGLPGATFQYLAPFQGPFVAVLVPPPGIQLANVVSVSVDVAASAFVQTSIAINSFSEVSAVGGVRTFAIGAASEASVIQYGAAGGIIRQVTRPVGPIEAIAPRVGPRPPLLPGQAPPRLAPHPPYLRGLPRPPGVRPGIRPGGPPILRPGQRPSFPGGRPPVSRPGERPGFPGGRPPVTRPGERPGIPGTRPPVSRPGERPGIPGTRPPVTRPGERPGIPGTRPPVSGPGGPAAPSIRPPTTRPSRRPGSPGARIPGGRPPLEQPERTGPQRPAAYRPGGLPHLERTPAEEYVPQPELRPLAAPQGPEQGIRPPALRPGVQQRGELKGETVDTPVDDSDE